MIDENDVAVENLRGYYSPELVGANSLSRIVVECAGKRSMSTLYYALYYFDVVISRLLR